MTIHESAAEIAALLPAGSHSRGVVEKVVKAVIKALAETFEDLPKDFATKALYNGVSVHGDLLDGTAEAQRMLQVARGLRQWFP